MRQKGNGGGKGGKGGKDKGDPSEAIGPAATLAAAHGPGVNVMCVDWSALDENMVVTGGSTFYSSTSCVIWISFLRDGEAQVAAGIPLVPRVLLGGTVWSPPPPAALPPPRPQAPRTAPSACGTGGAWGRRRKR